MSTPHVPPPPPGLRWQPPQETGFRFAVRWTFIVLGVLIGGVAIFPIIFGFVGMAIAPSRGRRMDTGFNYGLWFSIFYVIYLAFQPRA